jgi:hypothetical protein
MAHAFFRRLTHLAKMTIAPTVVIEQSTFPRKEPKPQGRPAHHCNDTQSLFVNPWESFGGMLRLDTRS